MSLKCGPASEPLQIKGFLESGNSVVIMLGEGGEGKYGTNINYLLEEYGMAINPDCAVLPKPSTLNLQP